MDSTLINNVFYLTSQAHSLSTLVSFFFHFINKIIISRRGKKLRKRKEKIVETQLETMINLKMFQGLEIFICKKERFWNFKTKFLNIIHHRPYIKKNDRNKVATI